MKCPKCKSEYFYEGFSAKECGNPGCALFVEGSKSANEFGKRNSPVEIKTCKEKRLPGTGDTIDLPVARWKDFIYKGSNGNDLSIRKFVLDRFSSKYSM